MEIIVVNETKFLTCQTSWREINNQCNHINSQLELYKFLNVYIDWAPPFSHSHNSGEIIIQNNDISTFFGHLKIENRTYKNFGRS